MKFLMNVLEREAIRQGISMHVTTQQEASELFEKIKVAVYRHDMKSKHRETLKWANWVKKVRKGSAENLVSV